MAPSSLAIAYLDPTALIPVVFKARSRLETLRRNASINSRC